MIGEWKEQLETHGPEWGVPAGVEWRFLLHNNYQPHYSGMNVFWFRKGDRDPLVVAKVFPEPVLAQQEFENLQDAHACAPESVPRPLGLFNRGDYWTLWMSAVPGSRLTANLLSDSGLDQLAGFLARVQVGVARKRNAFRQRHETLVADPIDTAVEQCPALSEACNWIRARYTPDWLESLPSLAQHGDLCANNVLVDSRGRWHIVDWETLGMIDLPYFDLVTFLLSLNADASAGAWSTSLRSHARRLIDRYSQALLLKRSDLIFMMPLLLANWVHFQIQSERKSVRTAVRALEDYLTQSDHWQQALLG